MCDNVAVIEMIMDGWMDGWMDGLHQMITCIGVLRATSSVNLVSTALPQNGPANALYIANTLVGTCTLPPDAFVHPTSARSANTVR